ncbi:MAG: ParB/RepB/Spo0J family partition protein [Minisyncoccia bacterium]
MDDYLNSIPNTSANSDGGGLGKGLQSLIPPKVTQSVPIDPPIAQFVPQVEQSPTPSPIYLEEDVDHNDKNDVDFNSATNVFDFSFINNRPIQENTPSSVNNLSVEPDTSREELNPVQELKVEDSNISEKENQTLPSKTVLENKQENTDFSDIRGRIFQIEVNKIIPNTQQPRQDFNNESLWELASSIKEYGILEPLVVSRHEEETNSGTTVSYQLISGERRLRASKLLGLKTVPVIIKESLDEKLKLELALIENIQREDLNSISKARAFTKLMSEFGLSQQAVATKMGKSREYVANILRLLQLPYEAQKAMEEGKINEGHARAILLLPNPEKRRALLGIILSKNISGREAEEIAKSYLSPEMLSQKTRGNRMSASMDTSDLQLKELLENIFKTRVDFKKKGEQGEIAIKFYSKDELEGILKTLLRNNEVSPSQPLNDAIIPDNKSDLPEFGTV